MFKDSTTIGVIIAMVFITGAIAAVLYFTRKLIAEEKILFLLVFLVTLFATVWAVDNVIAIRMELLSEKETDMILKNLENTISLVLGFYMGSKRQKEQL